MNDENLKDGIRPWRVGHVMALAVALLPFGMGGRQDRLQITAVVWSFHMTRVSSSFHIFGTEPWSVFNFVLVMLPQFLFPFQMVRFYQGKTTG
ncbi:MAG: hypothetical protein ACXABY_24275, partial [Candidatus Thorarchaeota archaeon]